MARARRAVGFVPYDRSSLWRRHDDYFARCGAAAWASGAIPSFATSNLAVARQHAQLLIAVVATLERAGRLGRRDRVTVLELGCGHGRFALSFFRALEARCGPSGRALAQRLRYVLSDYSLPTVEAALAMPGLARPQSDGRLVPALFDLRSPRALRTLEGEDVGAPLVAIVANYVCCVSPAKVVRKATGRYSEKWVSVVAPETEGAPPPLADHAVEEEWRPRTLARLFRDPFHRGALEEALAPFDVATLVYPFGFIDAVRALTARCLEGGLLLVNDYGHPGPEAITGYRDTRPQHFGDTLNHPVAFAALDVTLRRAGFGTARTSGLRSLHTLAGLWRADVPEPLARLFRRLYESREQSELLLDLHGAARLAASAGEHAQAARLYRRCLAIDPHSAEIHYRLAAAAAHAGEDRETLRWLTRGARRDGADELDFLLQMGKAHHRLHEHVPAMVCYKLHLAAGGGGDVLEALASAEEALVRASAPPAATRSGRTRHARHRETTLGGGS